MSSIVTVQPLRVVIRESIKNALRVHGGNVTDAARALGIGRATLYRWLENHWLDLGEFRTVRRA